MLPLFLEMGQNAIGSWHPLPDGFLTAALGFAVCLR